MKLRKNRKPNPGEIRLLDALITKSPGFRVPDNWRESLIVQPMEDGGMGSLRLFLGGEDENERVFGDEVGELQFTDADGVLVTASLNVDATGRLFELDVWKTDFSPLIRIPESLE